MLIFNCDQMEHDICKVPIDDLIPFLVDASSRSCPNIVSVGSGTGKYEKYLASVQDLATCRWNLVDPKPREFDKTPMKWSPHCSYTKDLVTQVPDVVGNCILLLIWPGQTGYDFEAVELLNPRGIVVLWEAQKDTKSHLLHGCAMGKNLFNVLTSGTKYNLQSQKLYASRGYNYEHFVGSCKMLQQLGMPITRESMMPFYEGARLWPRISWHCRKDCSTTGTKTTIDTTLHLIDHPAYTRPLI